MPDAVVDAILVLARQIPEPQRRFLEAVLREGQPLSELAATTAQSTSTLRRRYRRIINRLIEPRFGFVLTHRSSWPPQRRLVGTLHLVEGRTQRDTARRMGTTVHVVRREVYAIDALLSSHTTP